MFWRRPIVSGEIREWVDTCFDWFDARFRSPPAPILPTRDFFAAGSGTDQATAVAVVEDVKQHLRFDLPIDVVPLDVLPGHLRHTYQDLSAIAGTYQEGEDGRVIRYDPELMHQPLSFINTMAHEVMHARLAGLEDQVPGGREMHELATDLGCIIAGFGVFQLQAADDSGWSGYMTQPTRAFALARFLDNRGLGAEAVRAHLSGRCQKLLKRALSEL